MPKRSRSKSQYGKRAYKTARTNRAAVKYVPSTQAFNKSMYVSGVPRPLGRSIKTQHTYVTRNITLTPSLGVPASHVFSCNGLYDPDITGVGNQPVGFDQMTPIFDHYTVIYAKMIVDFHFSGSTSAYCGVKVNDNASTFSSGVPLIVGESSGQFMTTQKDHATVTRSVNLSKFLGRPNIMNEDDCRGDASNNPVEQAYFHVFNFPNEGNGESAYVLVRIEYVAIWSEPKALDFS